MKKTLSFILALVFVLSAFGVATLFSGVIGAGAEYFEYYAYDKLPGWEAFTDADLAELYNPGATLSQCDAPSFAPDRVKKATKFTITNNKPGTYEGFVNAYSCVLPMVGLPSTETSEGYIPAQWSNRKAPSSGTTLTGGRDFTDDTGICFWIGHNNGPALFNVKVNLICVPCAGPFYNGDEDLYTNCPGGHGFVFEANVTPDTDGYVYLDFKTDFYKVDWYWEYDDGSKDNCLGGDYTHRPLPQNCLPLISGMVVEFKNAEVGDEYYLGDFCAYRDSRVHIDELAEAIDKFDSLDGESYTEESYAAATEIYLQAYEALLDEDLSAHYTQKQVDALAKALIAAINDLDPLFPVKSEGIEINGFEVWDDSDLEQISEGGISLDPAVTVADYGPTDFALEIIANGDPTYSEPYYGWSCFNSTIDDDGEIVAVKNPFGADMSETNGLSFWLENPEDVAPNAMQLIVGKAGEVEFAAEDYSITRPLEAGESGYVSVSWNSFYDSEGDCDIYDYLDSLDYIGILFDDLRQTSYRVADLHPFTWSVHNADMTELKAVINGAVKYIATLNKDDWSVRSWQRLESAIENGRNLNSVYGTTQADVDAAIDAINSAINRLTLILNTAPEKDYLALQAAYYSSITYWHGNYTGKSYADMKAISDELAPIIEDEFSRDACLDYTERLTTAISNLVPITHGGIVDTILSPEDMTTRQFNQATGHRTPAETPNVDYSLVTSSDSVKLPLAKAIVMKATADLSTVITDQHGAMQFKLFNNLRNPIIPDIVVGGNTIGATIGDLSGTDGIRVWVGVNDVNLAKNAYFRFGVSNCQEGPLFERHAGNIPFPATGSGWLYIPWDYFEYYDEWTAGEMINLAEIRFWIARVDGEVPKGLEVYFTGIDAYKSTTTTSNAVPVISNVKEGDTVNVAESAFYPKWDLGAATLDGIYYTYGTPITGNGSHTLTVTNGDKKTTVNFTVTGGVNADTVPVIVGADNGGEYEEPVTLTWDVGEATLNGEPVDSGVVVSEPGSYTLEVINGTKSASISFTVKEKAPEVNKGDYDDDGEITVTDALAALRIAAKLAPETDDDIAICDTDNDGHVTVTDALAILRVAAKLAPPESIGFRPRGGFDA